MTGVERRRRGSHESNTAVRSGRCMVALKSRSQYKHPRPLEAREADAKHLSHACRDITTLLSNRSPFLTEALELRCKDE